MKSQWMIRDGLAQSQRLKAELRGDYFQLDQLSFEQLLFLATEYARLVHFYQLDLSTDGTWHPFFSADESILMASILALQANELAEQFEQRLLRQPQYRDWFRDDIVRKIDLSHREQLNSPLMLLRLFDQWYAALQVQQGRASRELRSLLEGVLRGLKWEVQTLCEATPRLLQSYTVKLFTEQFKAVVEWPLPQVSQNQTGSANNQLHGEAKSVSRNEMRHNFHTLNQALRMLQKGVRQLLPESLKSGQHDPAISLLLGFAQQYQLLQKRLNRFADKHIDFYYHEVLGLKQAAPHADSAYLVMQVSPSVPQVAIAKGTEFIAGQDEHLKDIVYTADESSILNTARVSSLHTIYFERHGRERRLLRTQASYYHPIETLDDKAEPGAHEKLPPLPLMGAPKPGEHIAGVNAARFGFAVASHTLLMQEGERHIRLLLKLRHNARYSIESSLRELAEQLSKKYPHHTEHASSLRLSDVFIKLMRSMFRVSITTETGWFAIPEYRPEYSGLNPDLPENCLALYLHLPSATPAITPYDSKVHGEEFQTKAPILQFEMTRNEYAYPYDVLTHWLLEEIELEVEVKACRQLVLHNQIGQLSALAPFSPFGPLPDLSSYLIVGCEEVLGKQLRDASVDIEWAGLPSNLGGFAEYYRGYQEPLKADAVKVKLSVLVDGKWSKSNNASPLFDFETKEDGSPSVQVRSENRIAFTPLMSLYKPTHPTLLPKDGARFIYNSSTMNGMFKLSLDEPAGAFGHQEYPQLLTRVLTQNAQKRKVGLMTAQPNPPYTPQISRIVFNYKAYSTINFDQSQSELASQHQEVFLHLHPMGSKVMRVNESKMIPLVPHYPAAGNLMIGLDAERLQGRLSLYFYLREDSLPMPRGTHTGLQWWYLSSNRWRRFQQAHILEDSTHGFMTSGIVQLQLPEDMNKDHTVMPSDQFWLGVTADQGIERFCSLYGVFAQAIKVTWAAEQGQKSTPVLPALRIQNSKSPIPGLNGVLQVRSSFNGKAAETREQFRTRASERLRHKQRALTTNDYESLILERFPQVYKVKCFPHLTSAQNPHHRIRPGHLLIVPIPHLNQGGHGNQRPTLSGHLIQEIHDFIRVFAPADVQISVENPVYEEIQIRCTVKLKNATPHARQLGAKLSAQSQMSGRYIEQINKAICEYLSPWNENGLHQHFGWHIQQHNVISFLHDLDYVDEVTGVSMLQISPLGDLSDLRFNLKDNAKLPRHEKDLNPSYPWSIAVPLTEHWIVISDQFEQKNPKALGINELKVGSTFIIPARKPT